MKRGRLLFPLIIGILLLVNNGCINTVNSGDPSILTLRLFAAAGTANPANEICTMFSGMNNLKIERNFASSGTLARQIRNGAEADIYISADKLWVDYLKNENLLIDSTIVALAKNRLVFICPKDAPEYKIDFSRDFPIESLDVKQIVIGDPDYVPAGRYTKQMLDSLDWFERIREKTIMAKDVVSVLHYVEMGACDLGVVYASEVRPNSNVRIVSVVPEMLYDPIVFYISMLKDADKSSIDLYQQFIHKDSDIVLKKYGFILN